MRHKVDDLIRELRRLPAPQHVGEQRNVDVRPLMPLSLPDNDLEVRAEIMPIVTVQAELFAIDSRRWLEWMIDINQGD